MYMLSSSLGKRKVVTRHSRWGLKRCFQKETVKNRRLLYRFNKGSYTCVANHHRSIILWSPIQFRELRSRRAPQPYPKPGHSQPKACLPSSPKVSRCVHAPSWLFVFVYGCLRRQQAKPKTPLLLAQVKVSWVAVRVGLETSQEKRKGLRKKLWNRRQARPEVTITYILKKLKKRLF